MSRRSNFLVGTVSCDFDVRWLHTEDNSSNHDNIQAEPAPEFNQGWLSGFKQRHNIKKRNLTTWEALSANVHS